MYIADVVYVDVIHFWYYFCNSEVGKILTSDTLSVSLIDYCYFGLKMHV